MNLSEHFTLEEATHSDTAIKLGISNQPDERQLGNLKKSAEGMEKVRALLGKPIGISSWLRLPEVNVAVGGSKVSAHMDGFAIDFTCPAVGVPLEIAKKIAASDIQYDQMIHEYGRWVHISFDSALRKQQLTIFKPEGKYKPGLLTEAEYHNA
jgi:putative chitinase